MLKDFFKSYVRIHQIHDGHGGELLENFSEELFKTGYAQLTAREHIRAAEHLMYWIDQNGMKIETLNDDVVKEFAAHLGRCKCATFGHCQHQHLERGARLFLRYFQSGCISTHRRIVTNSAAQDPVLLTAFCHWMRAQRGTSDATLYGYSIPIRQFLNRHGEDPSKFSARSLRDFVLQKSRQSGQDSAKKSAKALRMLLQFLIAEGKCVTGLESSIPVVAHWRLSSLPRYLQPEEVERVIASCDLVTSIGKRDYAILLLLARLGLRAGDVVRLRLDDINWKEAQVRVLGKGGRQTVLPLTQEVGNAIAGYVKDARPPANADAVFIRSRAPFCSFANHRAVTDLVTLAMRRAGVRCRRGAAHVLRHSAATSMLRHGASLQEISTILRHRSIDTTRIYAKVDVNALREIAQPWPEVNHVD